jgi:hypothetical protein
MKFQVGACALLLCLAGCSGNNSTAKFGDLYGSAAVNAKGGLQLPSVRSLRKASGSIANAPDRGALVNYKNKGIATKVTGAYTWYPVAISEEHALKAVVTGEMTIPSPDGSQVKLRYERHQEHPDGNWTWVGRVEGGDPNQEAILTFGEKAVFGSIPQPNGAPALGLETRNGVLWAVKTDPSKVKSANEGTVDVMVPPAKALRTSLAASTAVAQANVSQAAVAAGAPPTSANTIDVAIGYTQGFANALGGSSAAVTRLNFLIEVGNQAFTNSQINGYLRLVSATQVNYADNTANGTALEQLTGFNEANAPVTIPASLTPLRQARDTSGADLAVLMRDFQTPENAGCGIAWLNGANRTAINPATDDDYGFAVVSDGFDTGTDNKEYFCAPETLVHELAHLMGSAHDRDNSKKANGDLQYGRFDYSFGMKTTASTGNFYTIMAYGGDDQNFYRTFSNPSVLKCGPSNNLPCGVVDQTDNARSLNQTIPVVANFRVNVVPFPNGAANDINADGRSDLFLRYGTSGGFAGYWIMNGASIVAASSALAAPANHEVAAKGDFNGDGRLDVLWYRASDRNLVLWQGNATGGFDTIGVGGLSLGWLVSGAGDINADGRSDLFLRYGTSGGFAGYWIMNGASIVSASSALAAPANHDVAARGDFNGDGRLDVLWYRASDRNLVLWQGNATGGFDTIGVGGLSPGWLVSGAGDINADGRSDLFLRYGTSGGFGGYWIMNGASIVSASSALAAPANHDVSSRADFNGDGRLDVLWYRASDRNLVLWQGNATGGFDTVGVGGLGSGWTVSAD